MKKILLTLAVVSAFSFVGKAEMLYWQIDADNAAFKASGYTESEVWSSLWAFDGTSSDPKLLGYVQGFNQGSGNAASLTNPESASYYIELGSYATATYDAANYSGKFTYADLYLSASELQSSLASMKLKQAWTGKVTHSGAVPEPTSGLMMLVGMALLGLKRRRV